MFNIKFHPIIKEYVLFYRLHIFPIDVRVVLEYYVTTLHYRRTFFWLKLHIYWNRGNNDIAVTNFINKENF